MKRHQPQASLELKLAQPLIQLCIPLFAFAKTAQSAIRNSRTLIAAFVFFALGAVFFYSSALAATTLLIEDFNYTAGTTLTSNGWTAHSGAGTNAITVVTPGLTYTGYPSSGIGNSVAMTTTGEDVNRTFITQTVGSVYAAAMVNFTSTQTTGDYFFHLGPNPIGTTFVARVFAKKDPSSNNFAFGIQKGSTANAVYTPFSYVPGTTYLIVVKYNFVAGATNDTANLFVNPTLGGVEPAATITATVDTSSDASSIGSVALRQGSATNAPILRIDGIRVGDTWDNVTAVSSNPTGTGIANPNLVLPGGNSLLTVAVTPGAFPVSTGLTVTCNLTSIGGSASQKLYDDGTHGDVTPSDNTFSFGAVVAGGTSGGAKSLPCTIGDAQARTANAPIGLTVAAFLQIGTVNGVISDTVDAPTHNAAFLGQVVAVQGVIYEKTRQAISNSSNFYNGFFIQNTAATADGDPNTSDGLFVFMNTPSTIPGPTGPYTPTVGDEVIVAGTITEFFNMTEMQAPNLALISVVRSGVNLDAEIPAFVANPPINLNDANRYWERRQGMRGQVPANSIVLNGRNVFNPPDGEIWVARSDSTIAGRVDPYARRAFRDAHMLDDNYDANNWDGNGYRILMGSFGIKATEGNAQALLVPARTFSTMTNAPIGGVNYSFSKYRIEPSTQPILTAGVDPAANNPPSIVDRSRGYSIADFNLENLYDYRDNPFSGCDFTGGANTGCPARPFDLSSVNPPFDYVPASDAVYQARLNDIALQIINDLHNPDILMAQEVENQDICVVTNGALVCGTTDNADGKPDVLQELALKITSLGGPTYDAAFDRDSSDLRGIVPSFMYRTDRVQLLPAQSTDPVLGNNPVIGYAGAAAPFNTNVSNPKTLNATSLANTSGCETTRVFPRPPDIGLFRIYRTSIGVGDYRDVYVINNHFKSSPNACVAPRTEQAKYNAAIVQAIQTAKPTANVLVGGDLNVYPRPDDPFAPIGQPTSSDQLGSLYDPSLGLKNLWEVLLAQAPAAAYTYNFVGQAQTLDQMFVNPPLLNGLKEFRIAHINSDFPADYTGDVARGTSDHDPAVAAFLFPQTKLFLPLVTKDYVVAPDLIVQSITPIGNNLQVVIKNQGNSPVLDEFWVDLYVNPSSAPTRVNQIWQQLSSQGAVWGVTSAALPSLGPNGTLTLTLGDPYYQPALSNLSGTFPAGAKIYVQADSANILTTYGGVLENHEITNGPYNNITGITLGAPLILTPVRTGVNPAPANHLPPR